MIVVMTIPNSDFISNELFCSRSNIVEVALIEKNIMLLLLLLNRSVFQLLLLWWGNRSNNDYCNCVQSIYKVHIVLKTIIV